MIARLGLGISGIFAKTAPDPFVLAVLLTCVTVAFALVLPDEPMGVGELADVWGGGVWSLLAFGMQMCLVLVTGHAVASSPAVSRLLDGLAGLPRSGGQGVALVAVVACVLGVLNWGLGLIGGAIMARQVAESMERRGKAVHYPLLVAAGYVGMLVWHGGFSGSAPLKMTTGSDVAEVFGAGTTIEPLSLSETILSPMNLFVTGGLLVIVPVVLAMMSPRGADVRGVRAFVSAEPTTVTREAAGRKPLVPRLLEDSPIVTVVLAGLIGLWAWRFYVPADGEVSGVLRLSPNTVNLTMVLIGLVLHGTPARYVSAIEQAAGACSGIILQFPLYAGIMAIMKDSGLTTLFASALAGGGERQLALTTFVSAAVLNLFVPSGGGQWAVQGPIAMQAALDAGLAPEELGRIVMAVSYGDQVTNMLQPFWALPLLAITKCKARDMVGYTAIVMVVAGAWMVAGLMMF